MACGCNNSGNGYGNGWGGCGCNNTVQYAPSACNPNFPTTCTALGTGVIQRVVGEDSSYCKYTVPTLSSNSLLSYNASTGLVNWNDGTSANPIFIGSGNQASSSTVMSIQATTPTGQLVEFNPSTSAETQFPVVSPSGTTTAWGTIENIVPNAGVVYRPGSSTGAAGNVAQAYGTSDGQVLTWVASTNTPQFKSAVAPAAFIDAQAIKLVASSNTTISVSFGNMVFNSSTSGATPVQNGLGSTGPFALNIYGTAGPGALDVASPGPAANTYYYVYAIYNGSGSVNVVASTSYVQPSFSTGGPLQTAGYSYYRLIGMFYTNSSTTAGISTGYFQESRNVYLGQSNYIPIVTTSSTGGNTLLYYGGPVTFAPYQVCNAAIINFYNSGAASAQINSVIANTQAFGTPGTVTTSSSNHGITFSGSEIYGGGYMSTFGTQNYVNFETFIPASGSTYYNINNAAAYSTPTTLSIAGYKLSIF